MNNPSPTPNPTQSAPIRLVEVSARDGLQSRPEILTPAQRADWVRRLLDTGLDEAEAGSFVHPRKLPQLADTAKVMALLEDVADRLWVLVPNQHGLQDALAAGARNVVCMLSATETHSRDNLGSSIDETLAELARMRPVIENATVNARVALSMAWVDPVEGQVAVEIAATLCERIFEMGYGEITLCDTYGGASPDKVTELIERASEIFPIDRIGLHLHDTYHTAADNTRAGLAAGVTRFESAIGGLGGCPFAPGAKGNMDTLALVTMLEEKGLETNVDRQALERAAGRCLEVLTFYPTGIIDRKEKC